MKINKKGFEFSFGWIFALIVGAVVLFIAIYAVSNFIGQEKNIENTELAKELSVVLNPVSAGLESGKLTPISFSEESRVFNSCNTGGDTETERTFGIQEISVATKLPNGAWGEPGVPISVYNKYVFSQSTGEGERFLAFSKQLKMPWSISDVLYLIAENDEYCFIDPEKEIENEIDALGFKNINITDDIKKCSKNSKKVCFSSSGTGCEIVVDLQAQSVKKSGQRLYYADDIENDNVFLYGAIFSDPGIYNCQIKRLMQRSAQLAELYKEKSLSLEPRGCGSGLGEELDIYASAAKNMSSSSSLGEIEIFSEELERRNRLLSCKLF